MAQLAPAAIAFGEVTGIFNATIGNYRRVGGARASHSIQNSGKLRHTDPGDHPRGANRAGPMPTFTASTRINQRFCSVRSRYIARHDLNLIGHGFYPRNGLGNVLGMPMGGINND